MSFKYSDPLVPNFYNYSDNDPVNYYDLTGLAPESCNTIVVPVADSYMQPLGVEGNNANTGVGALVDLIASKKGKPTFLFEKGIGYYNKIDIKKDVKVCRNSETGNEVSREDLRGPYSVTDMSGTDVKGFDFDGDGLYSRPDVILFGFPFQNRVSVSD